MKRKRQASLISYFHFTPPKRRPTANFLDLPYALRRNIYLLAGLPQQATINLGGISFHQFISNARCISYLEPRHGVTYLDFPVRVQRTVFNRCHCWGCCVPTELMLVSRAIYQDVISILYSENTFTIGLVRSPSGGVFRRFRELGGQCLKHLSELVIVLNRHQRQDHCECYECWKLGRQQTILKDPSRSSLETVSICNGKQYLEFEKTVAFLKSLLGPGQLNLTVVLDTDEDENVLRCVKTISQLPRLRDCALRFCKDSKQKHVRFGMIRRAVLNLVTPSETKVFNRFNDLPIEIKKTILRYTGMPPQTQHVYGLTFRCDIVPYCCQKCTSIAGKPCCCNPRRAAYSTTCICWEIPYELLSVSKEVRHFALELLFGSQRLLVSQDWAVSPRLPLTAFFDRIPKVYLGYIRHLHLIQSIEVKDFGSTSEDYCRLKILPDWVEVIELIWKYCDVENLTFTLDMTLNLVETYNPHEWMVLLQDSRESDDDAWNMYYEIVKAMKHKISEISVRDANGTGSNSNQKLPRDFYVHLSYPISLHLRPIRHKRESILEQLIMGPDYNSALGRRKPIFPQYEVSGLICQRFATELKELVATSKSGFFDQMTLGQAQTSHAQKFKSVGCSVNCNGPWYCSAPRAKWESMRQRFEWWDAEKYWRSKMLPDGSWPDAVSGIDNRNRL